MPIPAVWRSEYRINTVQFAVNESDVDIAALANGRFALTWVSDDSVANDADARFTIRSANGDALSASFDDEIMSANGAVEEFRAAVAGLPDGRIVFTWDEEAVGGGERDVYAEVRNADGGNFADRFTITQPSGTATDDQDLPTVLGLSNGNLMVAYRDTQPATDTIRVRPYSIDGVLQGGNTISTTAATDSTNNRPQVAELANGNVVVTWSSGAFGASQQKLGIRAPSGLLVLAETDVNPEDAANEPPAGDVVALADGNFAVMFNRPGDANDIQGRLFDQDGNSLGGRFDISAGFGVNVVATALHDGRFMVVYDNFDNIFGRMMFANGTPDGAQFIISSAAGLQTDPAIATLADGRVVVSWGSSELGTNDIFAEIYDPREAGLNKSATSLDDDWAGTGFADTVFLGLGNDSLSAGGGNDIIHGEAGNDALNGEAGDDRLFGGNNGDTLNGGDDDDTLDGEVGNDSLDGGAGHDAVAGGAGNDVVNGGGGRDIAMFSFASTTAELTRGAAWSWNVIAGGETDNLFGVEVAQFTNRNIALREAGRSDISGDGTSDLVFYSAVLGQTSYYEMNPAGGYAWKNIGAVGPGYTPMTGDFNGDGEADVVWFNGTSLSYYDVNPGGGGYVWRNIGGVSPGHQTIVGDYDGDGTSDIAFFNQTTGALSWYDVNPAGGYTWRNIGAVGLGYTPLTGDFNGDGETDIGFFNGTSLSCYDIGNAGGYTWHVIGSVGPGHTALAGDFNNDGTTDVAFINQTTNAISYYAINPAGGYTWFNIGAVAPGYSATTADANGDGKTDIVFAGFGGVSYYDIGPTGGYTWHAIGGVGAGYVIVA